MDDDAIKMLLIICGMIVAVTAIIVAGSVALIALGS